MPGGLPTATLGLEPRARDDRVLPDRAHVALELLELCTPGGWTRSAATRSARSARSPSRRSAETSPRRRLADLADVLAAPAPVACSRVAARLGAGFGADLVGVVLGLALDLGGARLGGLDDRADLLAGGCGERLVAPAGGPLELLDLVGERAQVGVDRVAGRSPVARRGSPSSRCSVGPAPRALPPSSRVIAGPASASQSPAYATTAVRSSRVTSSRHPASLTRLPDQGASSPPSRPPTPPDRDRLSSASPSAIA